MKILEFVSVALKGFGMGAANVVPGVSGGTIALLTGIYSQLVDSLNSVTERGTWDALFHGRIREFWKCIGGSFLVALMVGVVVSIFSLAKLITFLLGSYPILTFAFFFGLILASAVAMCKDIKGWTPGSTVWIVLGIALGVVVSTLSPTQTPDDLWFIFICGAIAVCTMILPGISGSFMLLILGKYDFVMQSLSDVNVPVLLAFALGCVIGLLAFSKLLHFLLARYEKPTMLLLLGFVVGSLVKVWPWASAPEGSDPQIVPAVICCLAGVAVVVAMELPALLKERKQKR